TSPQELRSYAFVNQNTRLVTVPPRLFPLGTGGNGGQPRGSAGCLNGMQYLASASKQLTPEGNYAPAPYFLPGFLGQFGDDAVQAGYLARVAAGAQCLALLAMAVWFMWENRPLSLAGTIVAVTPMVLFVASSVTSSGLEICAGIAF